MGRLSPKLQWLLSVVQLIIQPHVNASHLHNTRIEANMARPLTKAGKVRAEVDISKTS